MTRDDIIRMAREASGGTVWWPVNSEILEHFAALVSAAEREECANVASWILKMPQNDVSAAIRARGVK